MWLFDFKRCRKSTCHEMKNVVLRKVMTGARMSKNNVPRPLDGDVRTRSS